MAVLASLLKTVVIVAGVSFLLRLLFQAWQLPQNEAQTLLRAALVALVSAPLLYFWVVRDLARRLTKTSAARASKLQFRALMDAVAEGAVFVDDEGLIMHVNRQAEEIFGFERTDLINQPVEVLVPERFREAHVGHRQRYMADPHRVPLGIGRELIGLRSDGSEFPMELSLSPIETERGHGVLALVTDISVRRAAAESAAAEPAAAEPAGNPAHGTPPAGTPPAGAPPSGAPPTT